MLVADALRRAYVSCEPGQLVEFEGEPCFFFSLQPRPSAIPMTVPISRVTTSSAARGMAMVMKRIFVSTTVVFCAIIIAINKTTKRVA